ncbi:hypothetical protein CesoFtcFv8_011837 [Champsocephalus esox]|uniref:Uncharacterized protein n=1 Tax=Champsocephalus esox TaxID=159716 RepID=A0AAN8H0U2_9TELE|nr:hypothetical protein CesoFtcFv8_011837 [Champsocephalus esox]
MLRPLLLKLQSTLKQLKVWSCMCFWLWSSLVIVSSLSVLVFCRKRICKDKEPHVETQCASEPEAEDDPSQHAYSEIAFVNVGSSHSGFHGDAERVIYSVPRVEASSDEPPLYSTVNNPQ